jgi:hypothetical protein
VSLGSAPLLVVLGAVVALLALAGWIGRRPSARERPGGPTPLPSG